MYTLSQNDNGTLDLSFAPGDDLLNCIIMSLAIVKGSWWLHPDFGLADRRRLKNSPATAQLIRADIAAALQWLLTAGRLRTVAVTTTKTAANRLEATVTAMAADGSPVSYTKFIEVV